MNKEQAKNRRETLEMIEMQKRAKTEMKARLEDAELKARYWKAQWEVKHYTLENEKLQEPYDAWLVEQNKRNEEAMKRFQEQMEKNKQAGIENEKVPELTLNEEVIPEEAEI